MIVFLSNLNCTDIYQNGIYYKAPKFSIKNTNITLGTYNFVGQVRNNSLIDIADSFALICQAIFINSKNYPITIDGNINIIVQEYNRILGSGQNAALQVLSNSLYFVANNTKLNSEMNIELGGIISNANFGTAKINSFASNDYGLPFISAGDLGRGSPDNQFSGSFEGMNLTFGQVQTTEYYNTFNATLQVLKHYNWTLVATIFQANTYGYTRQQSVLDYSSNNYSPQFTCNSIFGNLQSLAENSVNFAKVFCKCVNSKATIEVIVLWMSTSSAYVVSNLLRTYCSAAKKWTFIVTDDFQTPLNYDSNLDHLLRYSFLIRNNGPWNVKAFSQKCQDLAPPEAKEALNSLFNTYYKAVYNCELFPTVENENFKTCSNDLATLKERDGRCLCSANETDLDPYSVI